MGAIQSDAIMLRIFVIGRGGFDLRASCFGRACSNRRPSRRCTGDAQGEHGVGALDAPPSSWQLQALLCDLAMRAFDLSGADRQIPGQGVTIVQLVFPTAQIAMASSDGSLIVGQLRGSK